RGTGRQGGDVRLDLTQLRLQLLLATGQAGELVLSGFQLLTQGLQFPLALRDLLLQVSQRDDRHGGVLLRDHKGNDKTLVINVVARPSPFQESPGDRAGKKCGRFGLGGLYQAQAAGAVRCRWISSRRRADESERWPQKLFSVRRWA